MADKNEKIFQTLLEVSAEESLKQEMDEIPSCEELNKIYKPSPEMDKKMRGLIARGVYLRQVKIFTKTAGKVAAAFLILVVISATIMFSVEASRNYILSTFSNWYKGHALFEFQPDVTSFDKYSVNYIPDGFTLASTLNNDYMRTLIYMDKSGDRIVLQENLAVVISSLIDNEKRQHSLVSINGTEAYLFEINSSAASNILIWKKDDIVFELISRIDKEQLILIAENIVKM